MLPAALARLAPPVWLHRLATKAPFPLAITTATTPTTAPAALTSTGRGGNAGSEEEGAGARLRRRRLPLGLGPLSQEPLLGWRGDFRHCRPSPSLPGKDSWGAKRCCPQLFLSQRPLARHKEKSPTATSAVHCSIIDARNHARTHARTHERTHAPTHAPTHAQARVHTRTNRAIVKGRPSSAAAPLRW